MSHPHSLATAQQALYEVSRGGRGRGGDKEAHAVLVLQKKQVCSAIKSAQQATTHTQVMQPDTVLKKLEDDCRRTLYLQD